MASDLSNIIKEELSNTLEQLLSKKTSIEETSKVDPKEYESSQAIEVNVKFEFKTLSSQWAFYIPTISAGKFEYLMLGGMGELKEHIDDEVADAVNEIVANICGSITTSVNAQGYEDLGTVKFESLGSEIVGAEKFKDKENIFKFGVNMEDEKLPVLIAFDEGILPFIYEISGVEPQVEAAAPSASASSTPSPMGKVSAPVNEHVSSLLSLLGEDSITNLKLLFDIKLKLSVRLGTKIFLLKDILRWDIGEIIELEQMVNEPLEILVNGIKIGEGEAVIVEGKFGLKIKSIGNEQTRLSQIGLGN
ncbi:MAG: FliM/FliN family flagellar motor switch protein [Candidatus Marinarcus sp.]|uniref:FliM/FliN family flagellar motor switch protein n=1 Tax=Candidatus Marinarcus sp. TaxID=3100987 RepID=UPI003AFF73BC